MIAEYATRYLDRAKLHNRPTEQVEHLKHLSRERALYVTEMAKFKAQLTDQGDCMPPDIFAEKATLLAGVIAALGAETDAIDARMAEICRNSKQLARQMELLTSIHGVGKVVALAMIIETEAFTKFDNPRRFCTHAGVAPFRYTSGDSIRSKNKVSHRANRDIKRLLHMAAVSVLTKKDGELREYYDRKVSDGKNAMLVINALRAKLVARMFAVCATADIASATTPNLWQECNACSQPLAQSWPQEWSLYAQQRNENLLFLQSRQKTKCL